MSEPIFRTLTEADIDEVAALTARVFADDREEEDAVFQLTRAAYHSCPYMPPELCFAAEVDGRIAAKWQVLDFQMRIAGVPLRMGGIQAVVADPELNFKRYPELIAHFGIPRALEMGFDFVLGFAQRGGLYTRVGAVPLQSDYEVKLETRRVPALADAEDDFRPFDEASDLDALVGFWNRSNATRDGSIVRTPALWPWVLRKPPEIWMSRDGYLGVRINEGSLEVREVAGEGMAFYDRALRKLARAARELDRRVIHGHLPPDHPFVDMAHRYGVEIHTEVPKRSGCVGLPLHVAGSFEKLAPALSKRLEERGEDSGPLSIRFSRDGFDHTLLLCAAAGGATREIQMDLPGKALLQLLFGHRSAGSLAIEFDSALREADARLLDIVFPSGHPFTAHTDRF